MIFHTDGFYRFVAHQKVCATQIRRKDTSSLRIRNDIATKNIYHLPTQNLLKISPKTSSLVISPVMEPRCASASRRSSARRSVGMPASRPSDTFPNAIALFSSARACLALVTRIESESSIFHALTSSSSIFCSPSEYFALIDVIEMVLVLSLMDKT